MKKLLKAIALVLVLSVAVLTFLASGSDDDEPRKDSGTSGTVAENENAQVTEALWNVGDAKVTQWTDSIGSEWVQVVVPVTNIGSADLFVSSCGVDLEDENGHLVDTMSMVSFYPQVLLPGETGVYCEETIVDGSSGFALSALPHVKIEKSKVDATRFEVSDLDVSDEQYMGLKVTGRVMNTTDEEESVYIAAILYDANGSPLGVCYTISDKIAIGDKIGFSATSLMLPKGISASDVAKYEVFAYPYQFQF